jgi:hypothetical protein
MKNLILVLSVFVVTTMVGETQARDLTYRLGVGYAQMSQYFVEDSQNGRRELIQLNGIQATYGIARDMQVGAWFGMKEGFDVAGAGGLFRYDFQRLFSRDASLWDHLNLFGQVAMIAKLGSEQKSGVSLHAPTLGFEIMPFTRNQLAIATSFGLVIDFGGESNMSMTQSQFGDVGIRYYF